MSTRAWNWLARPSRWNEPSTAEQTQRALGLLVGNDGPGVGRRRSLCGISAEAEELARFAARLRVGGLPESEAPSERFLRGLEGRMEAEWSSARARAPRVVQAASRGPGARQGPLLTLRGARASLAAAAVAVALAVGGLSRGHEGLIASPTLTPTVGTAPATPSPDARPHAWRQGQGSSRLQQPRLEVRAWPASVPSASLPVPAPAPRSTPGAGEHTSG